MSNLSKAESEFAEQVIDVLWTMGSVVAKENQTVIELYKDNILFGKIENKKILLMDSSGVFSEVNKELVTQALKERRQYIYRDKLLVIMTKAYWLARKRKKSNEHLQYLLKMQM